MRTSYQKVLKNCLVFTCLIMLSAGCAIFRKSSEKKKTGSHKAQKEHKYKPYDKVVTKKAKTDKGLFKVHKIKEKYYFEIPDSLLSKKMLLVSRIAKSSDNLAYGGEKLNTQVVEWQKRRDQILLRHLSFENVANDTLPIYQAVENSNVPPIIAAFDIEALSKDSSASVIDVTDLYSDDIPALGLKKNQRKKYGIRRLDDDRSYINYIHSYPKNIEVRNLLTYQAQKPPSNASTGTITVEINHSMVMLPKNPMQERNYDRRIGYFSVSHTDYGSDAQKAKQARYITRYKLIPKDKQAYLNGKLVEPVNPIVYYIDPATPKKWRPYLKQGVEDWQKAFEAAGFKNAIIAKDPPSAKEDSAFNPDDVRYSTIRYFASKVQNAYGPNVHDPRTGQILESDIGWYHNVMNLLRDWYFVQTAAVNPEARHVKFSDKTMGELIRFVSSHEVGHTLGLAHNWGSSYAYPVDSLRSPTFTATHGTAPSIMDYARFNYVAQPGDGVKDFHPAIGKYDEWAIKWGYTWFPPDMDRKEREAKLDEWTRKRADNPVYFYGRQSGSRIDPRSQNEDLGNDAMKASELGIANLKRIVGNLVKWTYREDANYDDLEELYKNVVAQWSRYMGHVARNVGGVYETPKTYSQDGPVYSFVPKKKQKRAMDFLTDYAFTTPGWMINSDVLDRINRSSVVEDMGQTQAAVLRLLTGSDRLERLIEYKARYKKDTYTAYEMMDDLRNGVWSELDRNRSIDVYRRNLQRAYITRMKSLLNSDGTASSDIQPIVRNELEDLLRDIKRTKNRVSDRATQSHLEDSEVRIEHILNPDE